MEGTWRRDYVTPWHFELEVYLSVDSPHQATTIHHDQRKMNERENIKILFRVLHVH